MATDTNAGALCAVHEHCSVPANPGTVATFGFFVAGECGLVLWSDGVEVVGCGNHGHTQVQFL